MRTSAGRSATARARASSRCSSVHVYTGGRGDWRYRSCPRGCDMVCAHDAGGRSQKTFAPVSCAGAGRVGAAAGRGFERMAHTCTKALWYSS